ncbi:MAG: hypothetical protein EOQ55_03145 [Mesorhizobium sp.]|uniref:hypothetical protein n=1 Tax=Mesorhizobium sp. TaxID=1871066 RepID=UPI000FE4EA51|nr:hypothetical protein [Mesorhizobium sp.]RWG22545.1 MAG: hypothetical protein EOQ55_03145 [Mesorhizobium sp.]
MHFATLMGLRKIELADQPEIQDAILHISEPGESGYAGVDRVLTVNFDSMLWGRAQAKMVPTPTIRGRMLALEGILNDLWRRR